VIDLDSIEVRARDVERAVVGTPTALVFRDYISDVLSLVGEVRRLRAALDDYGQHLCGTNAGPPCPLSLSSAKGLVCTCGLDEVLS
jgi:hypothetical protein